MESKREVWQRGPIEKIPDLLQPVAHILLEVGEEVHRFMDGFPEELLWKRPAGVASPGFHLQHIAGVIDRLFTYARKELLSEEQMHSLSLEGKEDKTRFSGAELLIKLDQQIGRAISELEGVDESQLTERRTIGRRQIPTTLIGLYVHAGEHSMRHTGQLLVTTRILKAQESTQK